MPPARRLRTRYPRGAPNEDPLPPRCTECRAKRTRNPAGAVGPAPARPGVWAHRPRVPSKQAVLLAEHRLELTSVLATRVLLRAVDTTAMPGQPTAGLRVDVLAVS
jgi:hypothetical protein